MMCAKFALRSPISRKLGAQLGAAPSCVGILRKSWRGWRRVNFTSQDFPRRKVGADVGAARDARSPIRMGAVA